MSTLRIGIIGAGGIVKSRHLPGLRALPDVTVTAVCNRSRESGAAVAREWGIPDVMTDWRALVAREDLDAVFIGTWPYAHAEMSIAALEAGKHVFCQARMACDTTEAKAMLAVAEAHPKLTAMLCPPPHGMRGDRLIRRLLAEGYVGDLREVHAEGLSAGNIDPAAPLHWRQNFALQGYNTLTLGMWIEVIHRWVGPHRSVSALVKTHTPMRVDPETGEPKTVRIAESLAISAELANGAVGSYRFSGVTRFPPHNTIRLYGTEGSLHYDLDTDEITGGRSGDAQASPIPIPPQLVREWTVEADFIRAVRAGTPVEPSFRDGLQYMEFTEAVYRSSETGRATSLPLA
ncbi:MAG: Gfo/Idh/MocA family protein [Actinomycetota bacterium]